MNDLHVQTVAAHLGRLAERSDVVSAEGFSAAVQGDRGELRQFLLFVFSARGTTQPEYTWSRVLLDLSRPRMARWVLSGKCGLSLKPEKPCLAMKRSISSRS